MSNGYLHVETPGGTRAVDRVQVNGDWYPVGTGTALSLLFYSVIHAGGRGKVTYESPAAYFDCANMPTGDELEDMTDDDLRGIAKRRAAFLASPTVRRWRDRVAEIKNDPGKFIESAQERIRKGKLWAPPAPVLARAAAPRVRPRERLLRG